MQYFSTDRLPERDRLAFLHDFVGRHVARRQFTPLRDDDVNIELAAFDLPGKVTIGTCSYSPIAGARTRALIADGRDDYLLTVHNDDHELSVDGGPPIKVRAGDMMLVNEGMRAEFRLPRIKVSVVSLGYARLLDLVPHIDMKPYYHVPAGASGVALTRGYTELLYKNSSQATKAAAAAANHLYELVALVLDGIVKGETGRSERSISAARLTLVKKDIIDHLCEPDLSVSAIARSHGVSPRYLQRLFESEGITFSEFLRDSRLELALRRLQQDDPREISISAIAYDCGFSDLSYFNRSFRRRFGTTPSDVRADAMLKRIR